MERTPGRVIGAFTTAAAFAAAVIAGVSHQGVEARTKGDKAYTTWSDYEGSADSAQYSALTQINKSNVSQLQQVWFYPAGNNGFGFDPLVVDGVKYVVGKNNATVALDALNGKEIWVHDNGTPRNITNRGINYWESKDRSDRRLFYSSNNILHVLDVRTGKPVDTFGDHGNVDLREGLGRDPKKMRAIESGSPGRVFKNLLILGSATGEEYNSPPGDIRAYDVLTGKMVPAVFDVDGQEDLAFSARPSLKHLGPGGERATIEPAANAPQTQGFYVFALPNPAQK
jgi:quinoprotein glucose dehydrogenase